MPVLGGPSQGWVKVKPQPSRSVLGRLHDAIFGASYCAEIELSDDKAYGYEHEDQRGHYQVTHIVHRASLSV